MKSTSQKNLASNPSILIGQSAIVCFVRIPIKRESREWEKQFICFFHFGCCNWIFPNFVNKPYVSDVAGPTHGHCDWLPIHHLLHIQNINTHTAGLTTAHISCIVDRPCNQKKKNLIKKICKFISAADAAHVHSRGHLTETIIEFAAPPSPAENK